jgi:hypothetical protein
MIQLDRGFFLGIADDWLRARARRAAIIGAACLMALVVLALWISMKGRIESLEEKVTSAEASRLALWETYQWRMRTYEIRLTILEDQLRKPQPLFIVAEGYKGHIFVNGTEADH